MRTSLYDRHVECGAKIVDFHGWEMPIYYSGIIDEHNAVRNGCGLFDVSHMGQIQVHGKTALDSVQKLVTNDVSKALEGNAVYSPMCKEDGGIVDDLLVYGRQYGMMIVVNASNIKKDFNWIKKNIEDVKIENASDKTSLLAIQGPKSSHVIQRLVGKDIDQLKGMGVIDTEIGGKIIMLSRSGYTGEDGFEIYCDSDDAPFIWDKVLDEGNPVGIKPCGLGARDSLRLEAGLMLYGNDIDENTTPYEAPLKWTVKLEKDFIGKLAIQESEPRKKLVGFEIIGKRVPRSGNKIFIDMQEAGVVTSGIFSPTLGRSIGFCFVPPEHPKDKNIQIEIGGKFYDAKLSGTRFYKRSS